MVAILDAMGLCFFIGLSTETLHTLADLHHAKSGSDITFEKLVELGKNVLNMERKFNLGAGLVPVHHLPEFLEGEPLPPHQTVFDVPFMKVLDEVKRR